MKEKKRTENQTTGGGSDSLFAGAPGIPVNNIVNVSSGPYSEELPVAGLTAGEIRRQFAERLDIDKEAAVIINGKQADDNTVIKAGEYLAFIRHAGEKGASRIIIEDKVATLKSDDMCDCHIKLEDLTMRIRSNYSTGPSILPNGIKSVMSRGNIVIWIWEKPPHVANLKWIDENSEIKHGRGTQYRNVKIALPYLVIAVVFTSARGNEMPAPVFRDECFFRTEPLKSVNDELSFPALLNCSKFTPPQGNPLSWICTQYIEKHKLWAAATPEEWYRYYLEAVVKCLLHTGFNMSSEENEGNSWYSASKHIDPRIGTIKAWEKATEKDPLFVLDVPWIKTKHSVKSLCERIFKNHWAGDGGVSYDELANTIINHQEK